MVDPRLHWRAASVTLPLARLSGPQWTCCGPSLLTKKRSPSIFDQPRQVRLSLEKAGEPVVPPLSCVVRPGGPATVDVFLPVGCGLERGDRGRWVLRAWVREARRADEGQG